MDLNNTFQDEEVKKSMARKTARLFGTKYSIQSPLAIYRLEQSTQRWSNYSLISHSPLPEAVTSFCLASPFASKQFCHQFRSGYMILPYIPHQAPARHGCHPPLILLECFSTIAPNRCKHNSKWLQLGFHMSLV